MSVGKGNWASAVEDDTGASSVSPQHLYISAHASIAELQKNIPGYEDQVGQLITHINALAAATMSLRRHYDSLMDEQKGMAESLEQAEGRMAEVQRVVERYTAVADPVVASDGFTYERETITKYLNDCQAAKNVPMSQSQTELSMLLFPNRSLKRLLDILKETKPPGGAAGGGKHDAAGGTAAESQHGNKNTRGGSNGASTHLNNNNNINNNINNKESEKGAAAHSSSGERLHPCVRVYGYCNYKETCAYALYPYDACLSHLKGKCRFRAQCHEPHVDFKGPFNLTQANGESRAANAA